MSTHLSAIPLLVLLSLSSGCSILGKVDFGGLVTGGRDGWQHPDEVIEALDLSPGDRVAEIGAGSGYWLPWLSQAVGADGRVYAVEVTDELVTKLETRVADEGWQNVVVVRGAFEDPKLPDGEIDLAMTCLTYHHIEEREAYFRNLRSDLSSDGRVAHLDDRHDAPPPFRWLQGNGHWSDPESVRTEMAKAGYRRVAEYDFLLLQSFQVFAPEPETP
jgi:predicted methyltransferase